MNQRQSAPFALTAALLLAVLPAVAPTSEGRVFQRWRGAAAAGHVLESLGGTPAYRAAVTVNGVRGRLGVYAFDDSLERVLHGLDRRLGARPALDPDTGLAQARVTVAGNTVRLVVLRFPGVPTVLVCLFEHGADADPTHCTATRLPAGLEPFPTGRIAFSARDHETGTSFAVAAAGERPGSVRAFFESQLRDAGWSAARPDTDGLTVYTRGPEILCVAIQQPVPTRANSRITVLHKKQTVK